MSLPRYGVAIGTFVKMTRDNPKPGAYGNWYHGFVHLKAGSAKYKCAIDVSSPQGLPMLYAIIPDIDLATIDKVVQLGDGLHKLKSKKTSGALDYLRLDALTPSSWKKGKADSILDKIEERAKKAKRVLVFGDRFKTGDGMHDVHMNQGDPDDSQWFKANGIWQDGATLFLSKTGILSAILTRFPNQSMNTDNDGNPIP
jgi:hypothetical protein